MREFHRAPRGYELMVLINPEVTDEALTAAIDEVGGYITAPGAEVVYIKRDTPWGRRRLAYPIQRFRDATYVLFQFLASPSHLSEIERELKLDERVIRYLLVRQDNLHIPEEEEEKQGEPEGEAETDSEAEEEAQAESDESGQEESASPSEEDEADKTDEPDESDESDEPDSDEDEVDEKEEDESE